MINYNNRWLHWLEEGKTKLNQGVYGSLLIFVDVVEYNSILFANFCVYGSDLLFDFFFMFLVLLDTWNRFEGHEV